MTFRSTWDTFSRPWIYQKSYTINQSSNEMKADLEKEALDIALAMRCHIKWPTCEDEQGIRVHISHGSEGGKPAAIHYAVPIAFRDAVIDGKVVYTYDYRDGLTTDIRQFLPGEAVWDAQGRLVSRADVDPAPTVASSASGDTIGNPRVLIEGTEYALHRRR